MRGLWMALGFLDAVLCGGSIILYERTGTTESRNAATMFFILFVSCAAVLAFGNVCRGIK